MPNPQEPKNAGKRGEKFPPFPSFKEKKTFPLSFGDHTTDIMGSISSDRLLFRRFPPDVGARVVGWVPLG